MPNVKAEDISSFLDVYHSEIIINAEKYLQEEAPHLEAYSLAKMKHRIMISTIEGVGIEYGNFGENVSEYSPKALSTMLLRLPRQAELASVLFNGSGDSEVELSSSRMIDLLPFRIRNNSRVVLRDVTVEYGVSTNHVFYAEFYATRDKNYWSEANAIRRAAGVILQASTEKIKAAKNQIPLHEYIAEYKKKSVLLLGSYDPEGRQRLNRIRDILGKNYNVIIVDEIPENPVQSLPQKVSLIANLCRFVIVDDSAPSGHIQEVEIARNSNVITILLHEGGKRATFMNADLSINSLNIREFNYDTDNLVPSLETATEWAEQRLAKLGRQLKSVYPWRQNDIT